VHLFFTFWGFDIINKETMGNLKFSYLGNTAMHMPGHFGMAMPPGMAGLPGMTGVTTKMMKKQIADLDVPEVPEFLELLHGSGAKMWACRMSADMMHLERTTSTTASRPSSARPTSSSSPTARSCCSSDR
jgi:peroxiredoxin family protein